MTSIRLRLKENKIVSSQSENVNHVETMATQTNRSCSHVAYDSIIIIFQYGKRLCKLAITIGGMYIVWIGLHYIASHLYIQFCVPNTLYGFLMSPFMAATPHCQGLRWLIYNAAIMINNMWLTLGAWLCSTIFITNTGGTALT